MVVMAMTMTTMMMPVAMTMVPSIGIVARMVIIVFVVMIVEAPMMMAVTRIVCVGSTFGGGLPRKLRDEFVCHIDADAAHGAGKAASLSASGARGAGKFLFDVHESSFHR